MSAGEDESPADGETSTDEGSEGETDAEPDEIEWSTSEPEKTSKGLTTLQESENDEDG